MVEHPGEYPWSSYRANAGGAYSSALTQHPLYIALGVDKEQRPAAYRELFRFHLEAGLLDEIRCATSGNYALGSVRFQEEVPATLGRRVKRGRFGQPRKQQIDQ